MPETVMPTMHAPYVVYRREPDSVLHEPLPSPLRLLKWTPSLMSAAPPQLTHERNGFRKNWLFYLPTIVRSPARAYAVYMLVTDDAVVSQCIVTSASQRFPFMGAADWQVGLVATMPRFQRQGMGNLLLRGLLADGGGTVTQWWITEPNNSASRRLAESAGFALVGQAERHSRIGRAPCFALVGARR